MAPKVLIKWNDFNSSIPCSYKSLREERDFIDITLVSDDEMKFEAHKVVLSASSPFFRNILRGASKNVNTIIFLSGVRSSDLQLVMDFVYNGEVKLHQENIPSFLEATSKLKISGLSEQVPESEEPIQNMFDKSDNTNIQDFITCHKLENELLLNAYIDTSIENMGMSDDVDSKNTIASEGKWETSGPQKFQQEDDKPVLSQQDSNRKVVNQFPPAEIVYDFKGNTNIELLEAKITEIAQKLEGKRYGCRVCGRSSRDRSGISAHIETHFEGLSFTCELCEKEFKSREAIRKHKQRHANGGIKRPFNVYGY